MLKQVQLSPNAGLSVSQLCLGTMNFGVPVVATKETGPLMLTLRDRFSNPPKRWALPILIAQTFMV